MSLSILVHFNSAELVNDLRMTKYWTSHRDHQPEEHDLFKMNATVVSMDQEPGVHAFLEQQFAQQCLEKCQVQLLGREK